MNRSVMRLGLVVLFAAVFCATGGFAYAQTSLGRVAGTVVDASGGVLPGATITLTNIGTNEVRTTVSDASGAFIFQQVPVGTYKATVALDGFKTAEFTDVSVAVGQDYSLTARLGIGEITETVTVMAGSSLVQTTSPEVSSTVMQRQVLDIPLADRSIQLLIRLQAGVPGITSGANTAINGGRPTWTQVTLDGINIQDNFIRTNSLDFLPNRPTSDNVAEFSITTSVSGADNAGGATSVRMVTPSGSNRLTGSVYEFNRDAKFAANSFFNNASGVPKPELSRHDFGGRLGGPIQRDKLFFFFNYEGRRQTTDNSPNLTIPAHADFFDGVFRYVDGSGTVRSVNVMQLSGLTVDPTLRAGFFSRVPESSNVNNFTTGDSTAARLLNTAGFRGLQTDLNERNSFTGRLDYAMTTAHRLEGVFSHFKETDDRTDIDNVSQPRPLAFTDSDPKRLSLAWRWAKSANLNNELRGGFNLAPVRFETNVDFGDGLLFGTALGIVNPIVGFQPQGRNTNTYQLTDNASYLAGSHQIQMGGSWQRRLINPYNFAGRFPTINFGFSTAAPQSVQLSSSQFPGGIAAADLTRANATAAWLGGVVSSTSQTFQVRDKTSGFVPGIPSNENYTADTVALFVQDNWRLKPNFTIRAGLKWEYYSPLRERDDLGLMPQFNGRPFREAMLDPTMTLSFVDGEFYNKDLNNFAPTVGFAWDVTKDGRTAVRGGYSLTYVDEDSVTVARSVGRSNSGLTATATRSNLFATVSGGVPLPVTPEFKSVRTLADQMALSTTGVLWGVDPDIKQPHVHQVSVGIQRELPWSLAAEARYVGTFGRGIWRGVDFNQLDLSQEFVDDFVRARTNGFLAQQAGLGFNPLFNANVPGSQPLTLLPALGLPLRNATVVNSIQQAELGRFADLHMTGLGAAGRANSRALFLQNPAIYAVDSIINGGFNNYNALQLELRRQFRGGFFGQVNYTLADTKTNSTGTGQNRFEAFMDNNRPGLDEGRSVFHISHVLNANAIYELPFGDGRRWLNGGGLSNVLLGGWQISGILALQSGEPFSITSGRGTFNRAGRSGNNNALSNLSVSEIQKMIGVFKQPDGRIFWIDPKVINTATGRGVGADNLQNSAGFAGQVFFNPGVSEVGNLPVRAFDGPRSFRLDLALSKRTRIAGRYNFELKGEAFNVTNSVSFNMGNTNINGTSFGQITGVVVGSRVVQLSARFDF
ncbi:MAG TPA: TonB-dependent receptor [Planctomycetaceae bacterium]|nr:TonB-dependent receptor [Planctomycetaceae bacterium]